MLSRTCLPRAPALLSRRMASSSYSSSTRPSRRPVPTRRPSRRPQPQPQFSPPPSDDAASARRQSRRIALTGAVSLITVAGALTGAWLKKDYDASKQRQEVQELPVEERIALLESRRAELVRLKTPLEKKLAESRERVEAERSLAEQKNKMMMKEETEFDGSK